MRGEGLMGKDGRGDGQKGGDPKRLHLYTNILLKLCSLPAAVWYVGRNADKCLENESNKGHCLFRRQ